MSRRFIFIALALSLLTFYVYSDILNHPFIYYDDEEYITRNPMVQQGLSWRSIQWAFSTFETGDWQPLVWISFILNEQFFGLNPPAFHGINLILHSINVLLVFFILCRMTNKIWAAAFMAAFFAIHPLRVESVAWIAERKDVLSGLFWWLTLGAYVEAKKTGKKVFEHLTLSFFILAILSKPMVVTLPAVLLLIDFSVLGRIQSFSSFIKRLWEKIPLGLIALFSCIMAYSANASVGGIASLDKMPLESRFFNSFLSYWSYIRKTLWPVDLAIYYPFPSKSTFTLGLVSACVAGLVFVSWFAVKTRRSMPFFFMGWFWYLITLLPVIGIVPISLHAMADRYTYIPHLGLGLMAVDIALNIRLPFAKKILPFLGFFVIASCAVLAKQQTQHWSSPVALNLHAAKVIPDNYVAHGNLGYAYLKMGDWRNAKKHFRENLRIRPNSYFATSRLAAILASRRQFDEAKEMFLYALRIRPKSVSPRYNLGVIATLQSDEKTAERYFLEVLEIKPDWLSAKVGLAQIYIQQNRLKEAEDMARQILTKNPYHAGAHFQLGLLAEKRGDVKEAVRLYELSSNLKMPSPRAMNRLAYFRTQEGKSEEAKKLLKRAIKKEPFFENAYINLGNLLLLEKDYEGAILLLQSAVGRMPYSTRIQKLYLKAMLGANSAPTDPEPSASNPFNISSKQDFEILLRALSQTTLAS